MVRDGDRQEDAPADNSLPAAVLSEAGDTARPPREGWPDPRRPVLPMWCFELLKGTEDKEAVHWVVKST